MTLKELKEIIDGDLASDPSIGDFKISIVRSEESWFGNTCAGITSVAAGFDMDDGRFLIYPNIPLVQKTDSQILWEKAQDLLCYLASKPVKSPSYPIREARSILKDAGIDYSVYEELYHRK